MALKRKLAPPSLAAVAFAAALAGAAAQERGAGASGRGDGSGMGQNNTETGTAKGPGDARKGDGRSSAPNPAGENTQDAAPGAPAGAPGLIKQCDDGRTPANGACPD
jgi:hypothetical protein